MSKIDDSNTHVNEVYAPTRNSKAKFQWWIETALFGDN